MHTIDNRSLGADGTKVFDANGDGRLDIVCGWEQGNITRVYLQPAALDQPWPFVELPSPEVEDALLADLDGDGATDVVTFSEGDHRRITIHWAPSSADAYLQADAWTHADIACTLGLTQWMFGQAMDVDGTYGLDLVVGAKNEGALLGWLEAPANPRDMSAWRLHPISPVGWIMSIELMDMDGDGQTDLLISDRKGPGRGVKWYRHPGKEAAARGEAWTEQLIGLTQGNPMFLGASQEGGRWHIWVPNHRDSLLQFRQRNAAATDWATASWPFPEGSGRIGKSAALGDLNQDGYLDVITTYEGAAHLQGVMASLGNEQGSFQRHVPVSGLEGIKYDFARLIDMDADGDLDVLTSEENDNARGGQGGLGVVWYENPQGRP